MFEHRHQPVLSRARFRQRLLNSGLVVVALVATALSIGTLGYHLIAELDWLDALLNASMILTGMGPVDQMPTAASKLFASFFALFSGVVFPASVAIMGAPLLHRLLHRFHMEVRESDQ